MAQVFALGFVSVFDQITEGLPGTGPTDIFNSYMAALQEDPEQYRKYVFSQPYNTMFCICKFLLWLHTSASVLAVILYAWLLHYHTF